MLLATHGTMVYHPNPVDLWRWTGAGLERLFRENGDWAFGYGVRRVRHGLPSLAMLNAIYLEHVLRRTPFRSVRGPVVSVLNRVARALDRRVTRLRDERPGTLDELPRRRGKPRDPRSPPGLARQVLSGDAPAPRR